MSDRDVEQLLTDATGPGRALAAARFAEQSASASYVGVVLCEMTRRIVVGPTDAT